MRPGMGTAEVPTDAAGGAQPWSPAPGRGHAAVGGAPREGQEDPESAKGVAREDQGVGGR